MKIGIQSEQLLTLSVVCYRSRTFRQGLLESCLIAEKDINCPTGILFVSLILALLEFGSLSVLFCVYTRYHSSY